MNIGSLRKEIMDGCPEGFEDDLKAIIDDLEQKVGEIVGKLNITCIGEMDNIEDAHRLADELADSLY